MEATGGRTKPALSQILLNEPYRFDFFQAVRLLERIFTERHSIGRVGEEGQVSDPNDEIVRFRTNVSLRFPASQIVDIRPTEDEKTTVPREMEVAFMGLTGPLGVLPHFYTEMLIDRLQAKDRTMYDFLDLFNHRFISFFYRAWEKYRFPVAYERGSGDSFTTALFNIIGLGTDGLRQQLDFREDGLLCYGGLIIQRPHSASAVAAIIGDYFQVPTAIRQFTGQWLKLEPDNYSLLGAANHTLGGNTIAGTRVWESQSKFRLQIGALSYRQFEDFLPIGAAFNALMEMTRYLVGQELDFDVQLILKASEVPDGNLTTQTRRKMLLGWNTWLKTKPFANDDGQVVLSTAGI